jgi:hypothetical protein
MFLAFVTFVIGLARYLFSPWLTLLDLIRPNYCFEWIIKTNKFKWKLKQFFLQRKLKQLNIAFLFIYPMCLWSYWLSCTPCISKWEKIWDLFFLRGSKSDFLQLSWTIF